MARHFRLLNFGFNVWGGYEFRFDSGYFGGQFAVLKIEFLDFESHPEIIGIVSVNLFGFVIEMFLSNM